MLERRRLYILNTLCRELERRGFTIDDDRRQGAALFARLGRDSVRFSPSERIRHIRRQLTEEEIKQRSYGRQNWGQT